MRVEVPKRDVEQQVSHFLGLSKLVRILSMSGPGINSRIKPNYQRGEINPWKRQSGRSLSDSAFGSNIGAPLNVLGMRRQATESTVSISVGTTAFGQSLENLPPLSRLEAALFLSREVVNTRRLAALAGLADGTEARTLIQQLNQQYDQRGRAFQVMKVAGGYQLLTRPAYSKWIRQLEHIPNISRLSTPVLETLAVVAYRQPIVRAEIDAIRGVSSGELLRQLLERDLVRISGRSDDLGRPFLYATTRHFLKLFGLGSLDELPEAEKLRSPWISSDQSPAEVEDSDQVQLQSDGEPDA